MDALAEKIEIELGDLVFSDNGDSLEQIVGYYLQMRHATLAAAESLHRRPTRGTALLRLRGSSRYFLGGAVVYSNELKTKFADVPAELIEKHGAVSSEVAIALAEGIRKRCAATIGVGITGVAGPAGGTEEKPVGLVFHAVASEQGTEVIERRFPGRPAENPMVCVAGGFGYGEKEIGGVGVERCGSLLLWTWMMRSAAAFNGSWKEFRNSLPTCDGFGRSRCM